MFSSILCTCTQKKKNIKHLHTLAVAKSVPFLGSLFVQIQVLIECTYPFCMVHYMVHSSDRLLKQHSHWDTARHSYPPAQKSQLHKKYNQIYVSLVPRLHPAFQCWMLKSGRAWYTKWRLWCLGVRVVVGIVRGLMCELVQQTNFGREMVGDRSFRMEWNKDWIQQRLNWCQFDGFHRPSSMVKDHGLIWLSSSQPFLCRRRSEPASKTAKVLS